MSTDDPSCPDAGGRLYCFRCGNLWSPEEGPVPKLCPRCRTSRWNTPVRKRSRCTGCGCEWTRERIHEPCPRCGRSDEGDGGDSLHCNQCDYTWVRRNDSDPMRCPACKSCMWNLPKLHQFTCLRCGHVWRNRAERPRKCPNCQSMKWDTPVYRLQCRRCGYKWSARSGKTSEDVTMCPSCKSRRWNETPDIQTCASCGRFFITRKPSDNPRCPGCSSRRTSFSNRCTFCGATWDSTEDWLACPRCGKERDGTGGKSVEIWSDGTSVLRYVFTDGMAFIYLWEGDIPVSTMYFKDLLRRTGLTANQMMLRFSDPVYGSMWAELAKEMSDARDEYMDDVPYLSKRLNIGITDAKVLAIHFRGMGPEAISVRFGLPIEDVRRSFDRIMAAFVDNGIVVDDTTFTDDAMSMY